MWKAYLEPVPTQALAEELIRRQREQLEATRPIPRPVFCGVCGGIIRSGQVHTCQETA